MSTKKLSVAAGGSSSEKKSVPKKTAEKKPVPKKAAEKKSASTATPRKQAAAVASGQTAQDEKSRTLAFSIAEEMKRLHKERAESEAAAEMEIRITRRPTTRARGQDTLRFPDSDLEEFKKRLILLRQQTLGQATTLKTVALEQTDDRGSEDDDGSDAFMRLQSLSQVDVQNKTIQKIDEALQRIAEGSYGICEICGQLIRKPRLMNLPFAHTCIECQSAMEDPNGKR